MLHNDPDPKKRFSDRVAAYVKYRPDYPIEIVEFLNSELGFSSSNVVADIGSGTGKSSKIFLDNGNPLYAVEPNENMQAAAIEIFGSYSNFHPINGTAEQTGLAVDSVDVIVAGQAFHWFDVPKTINEFRRILRQDGYVLLMWNKRDDEYPFMYAYNEFIKKFSSDYEKISLRRVDDATYSKLFNSDGYQLKTFPNSQSFDFDGLMGRYQSSSYAFKKGHPKYENVLEDLKVIFEKHAVDGMVELNYVTEVYYGRV